MPVLKWRDFAVMTSRNGSDRVTIAAVFEDGTTLNTELSHEDADSFIAECILEGARKEGK